MAFDPSKYPRLAALGLDWTKRIRPQLDALPDDDHRGMVRAALINKVIDLAWDNPFLYGGAGHLQWTDPASGLTVRLLEPPEYAESFPRLWEAPAFHVMLGVTDVNGTELDLGDANPFIYPNPILGDAENVGLTLAQELLAARKAIFAQMLWNIRRVVNV